MPYIKDDGVPSLVQAVKEHRKFKQLACYSIECVAKVGRNPFQEGRLSSFSQQRGRYAGEAGSPPGI